VPDTNVFLHYQTVDQIDWCGLLAAESVSIIVPQIIIRELNAAKDGHPSPKIRKRAAAALRRLDELSQRGFEVELRAHVILCFETSEPALDLAANQLNPQSQDDVLLACLIAFKGTHPDERVVLATADLGLKLKARYRSIEVLSLPDALKLPDDPDPNEQRVKELEARVRELSVTVPSLVTTFADGQDHCRFGVARVEEPTAAAVESEMAQVMAVNPQLSPSTGKPVEEHPQSNDMLSMIEEARLSTLRLYEQPSPDDIANYNQSLGEFYARYKEYILSRWEYQNTAARTSILKLVLRNDGNWPAEDIDVMLHFPDGCALRKKENRIDPPGEPQPPERPKGGPSWMREFDHRQFMTNPSVFLPPRVQLPGNVSGPTIRRSSSYDVEFHVRRLKHGFSATLDPLFLTFDSYEEAGSFAIDFRINAGNMPKESVGQVHVIVDKVDMPIPVAEFKDPHDEQQEEDVSDDE
jgi:rRNA-processing protein FCF1